MSTHAPAVAVERPGSEPEDLARKALAGDRAAETEVCRRLLPAVRAFARRRLAPAAAEDFAQDAIVLVVEALRDRRVNEPQHVASYALGICRNLARERARMGERRRALLEKFGLTDEDLVVLDAPLEIRRDHLEDCYSQLTQRARAVIRATFCDDGDDDEIASQLSITEANVRVIRHRTLAALRSCLERPVSWDGAPR